MSWNFVLQGNYQGRGGSCLRATVPGLVEPAQIHFLSCDRSIDSLVKRLLGWIATHLGEPSTKNCSGPGSQGLDGGLDCQAFDEAACRHVLVVFKAAGVPIDSQAENLATRWRGKAGANGHIVVVLPPGEGNGDLPPSLTHYHRLTHPAPDFELGLPILRAAGIGARQKLFLSYRRQDSRALADQIHEGLARRGFQVYVDRFAWTPGRLFPEEIAEELADRGVMLLLESDGLHLSHWTQWELSFARMYHLGILALNINGAAHQRGIGPSDRFDVAPNKGGQLSGPDVKTALDFIVRRYNLAESRRRIYFEALVRRAAALGGGTMDARTDGLFEVRGKHHGGLVLPSGRPANLGDICRLGRASSASPVGTRQAAILVGQHGHLPPSAREDVSWLAGEIQLKTASIMQVFSSVRNLIQTGRP